MDLTKGPNGTVAKPRGPSLTILVLGLVALIALALAFVSMDGKQVAEPAMAAVQPKVAVRKAAPTPMKATPTMFVRVEWYEPFDPKTTDDIYGRVQDQYGCWWWTRISSGKYEHSERAYGKDGRPDCPADALPRPLVDYVEKGVEMRDGVTIVSMREVKAGDPDLVAFFRARRDEAAEGYAR